MDWLKPSEVKSPGLYFMARSDDPDWLEANGKRYLIKIFSDGKEFYWRYHSEQQRVLDTDLEVRWLGPIPNPAGD